MNDKALPILLLVLIVALSILYIATRLSRPYKKPTTEKTVSPPRYPALVAARHRDQQERSKAQARATSACFYTVGPPRNPEPWTDEIVLNDAEFQVWADKKYGPGTYESIIHP